MKEFDSYLISLLMPGWLKSYNDYVGDETN